MKLIGYIALLLLILFGVTFACLNAEKVPVNYYVGERDIPLSLLLVITLALGAVIGFCVSLIPIIMLKAGNFRLRQRVRLAEKEILNLRTMPLQDNR